MGTWFSSSLLHGSSIVSYDESDNIMSLHGTFISVDSILYEIKGFGCLDMDQFGKILKIMYPYMVL